MTEIPEHLRKRAEEARRRNTIDTASTVEVPVYLLESLRTNYGTSSFPAIQALVALIPEPAYEPDEDMVFDLILATSLSVEEARQLLVDLHDAGLTITDQPERN